MMLPGPRRRGRRTGRIGTETPRAGLPSAPMPRPSPSRVPAPSVAIVVSRYNATVTDALLSGARAAYAERGGRDADLCVVDAPGAFELPALCNAAARTGRFAGVLALGCVIKGETSHDRYISHAVAQGLVNVTLNTDVPCALGVLTVDTPEQALERAGGVHGNKGVEAMGALLDTIGQIRALGRSGGDEPTTRGMDKSGAGRQLPDKAARGPAKSKADKAQGKR